jgi:AcrR family transcriptional regulator
LQRKKVNSNLVPMAAETKPQIAVLNADSELVSGVRAPTAGAQAKRAAVITAGAAVFLEQGFGAAAMDEVARRAQVSKATIYSYFSGKQALFEAIIGERCASMIPATFAAELADLPPEAALRVIGERFLGALLSPDALPLYRVVLAESPRFPELGEGFYRNGPARIAGALAEYLAGQQGKGALDFADVRLAAEQFLGMVLGHMHVRMLLAVSPAPAPEAIARAVGQAVRIFVDGARNRG